MVLTLALLAGCQGEDPPPGAAPGPTPAPEPVPAEPVWLSPVDHLIRVSVAVRGVRPSEAELAAVEADPEAIGGLLDGWLRSPEFEETVRDLHAELFRVRVDLVPPFPAMGPLEDWTGAEIQEATSEEVLRLVSHVVANDLPYTEIVTADYMVANAPLAAIYGLPYDRDGVEWQVTRWTDGRESAGVLSSSELWRRQPSAGNNFQRHRANFVADTFLCEDFASREVVLRGDVDLSDPIAVATALSTNPACVACHQALDPLAAAFWGYKQHLDEGPVELAMKLGCHEAPVDDPESEESPFDQRFEDYCYPVRFYTPAHETMYREFALPEPAYYGAPYTGLAELGAMIADDPRFHQCTVRHFLGWFHQADEEDLPFEVVLARADSFAASGFDARQLVRDIVLDDAFRMAAPPADRPESEVFFAPTLVTRPEQYARIVEALTGFRWLAGPDEPPYCWPYCLGAIDLGRSDSFGYRALAGGIDGLQTLRPTHQPTPTKLMAMERFAQEAAGWVVEQDLAPGAVRRLLLAVDADTTDEAAVRDEIAGLHRRMLGIAVATDSAEVDEIYTLFAASAATSDPVSAWKLVVATLLQDPRLWFT